MLTTKTNRFLSIALALCMALALLPALPRAAQAAGTQTVVISDSDVITTGGVSPGSLNEKFANAIEAAGSGGTVIVTGSKTNADRTLDFNIRDRTVIWKATWESVARIELTTQSGAGTFEVAAGGSIKNTSGAGFGSAISGSMALNNSNNITIKVTGGYVESNGSTAIDSGASNVTVIVTGGTVKTSSGVNFPVHLTGDNGLCVFLDGTVPYIYNPVYGKIVRVSTLSPSASDVGTSYGLTVLLGGGTAVWKSAGGSPVISVSMPDEKRNIGLGSSGTAGAQTVVISDSDVITTGGISPGSLNAKLRDAIEAAGSGGTVVVTGSKTNADRTLDFNILDRTVIWKATWESVARIELMTQSGAGTFEVAAGGSIKNTSGAGYGTAISGSMALNNSNNITIKVTGGHVESNGSTAIDSGASNVTVIVTGGTVKAGSGVNFPVHLTGDNGVCVFLDGTLTYTVPPVYGKIVRTSRLESVPGSTIGLTLLHGGGSAAWSASGDSIDILTPKPPRDVPWGQFRSVVTLDWMGGSGGSASVEPETGKAMPAITTPTRTGYIFNGYWDAAAGGTRYYTAAGASARNWDKTGNATLYAQWTLEPSVVTLDKTGGAGGPADVTVAYGAVMPKIDTPTRAGYVFNGYWDAAMGGTRYYTNLGWSAKNWDKTGDVTLYAQWIGKLAYTPSPAFDIPAGQINAPFAPIDVSSGISGGSGNYIFTRNGVSDSALNWIQVSEDGEISSSTGARPSAMHGEGTLKISVRDEITFEYLIFTVNVGATTDPNVTFTATQTDGFPLLKDSAGIALKFNQPVTGLTAGDITVTNGTGVVTTGALSGYGTAWTLELTSVTTPGTVTVSVADFGAFSVTTAPVSVSVYKDQTANGVEVTYTSGSPVTGVYDASAYYNVDPFTHMGTGDVEWFADAEGNIPASAPGGVIPEFSGPFTGGNQTLRMRTSMGPYTDAGVYYFRVTVGGGGVSNMAALTVKNTTANSLVYYMVPAYYELNHSVPAGDCGTAYKSLNALSLRASGLMVWGGIPLYTFSIDGPDWLEISHMEETAPGVYVSYIVGTRPLTPQAATTAKLIVTDMAGDTAEITINVGAVTAAGVADTVPSAPGGLTAIAGDGQVELSWVAPYDGGSPITGYAYRIGGGSWNSTGSTATAYTVTGLTNGTAYSFEVRAVNSVGAGDSSGPQAATPKAELSFTAEQTGGINNAKDSTGIVLTFNKSVSGLTIGDITIIDGTGEAVKGASLTGSGAAYTVTLDSVGKQGDVTVKADDFGGFILTVGEVYPVAVYKDSTPPTGAITMKGNDFTAFLNTVSFGFFFKNNVDVTIAGSDDSGIKSVRYLHTDVVYDSIDDMGGVIWTAYPAGGFSVTSGKSYVYAEITDNNDLVTIIRSGGVVIYADSAQGTANISFTKGSGEDKDATVNLNGNTVAGIMNGAETLGYYDYYDYGDGTITFFESYLDTLAAGSYTLTVYYNPLGEVFDTGDAPAATTIGLTIVPASVKTDVSFTAAQTGGASGTADSAGIVLTFSAAVTGLTAGDVTITNGTGAVTKGALSGSGSVWTIALSSVTAQGSVTVSVGSFGAFNVTTAPQTVAVYKNAPLPTHTTTGGGTTYYSAKPETEGGITPTPGPEKWVNPFEDVKAKDWFYGAVEYVYVNGLMVGTNASPMLFSPNMSTTRAMIVTILYHQAGAPGVAGLANPFSDVPAGQWYTDAVIWAASEGIVTGYGNGLFGTNDDVTRQDLACILAHYADFAGITLPVTREYAGFLDDADIADYAKDAVRRFFEAGVISGRPGNIFDPKGSATRAEAAAMLRGFLTAAE